MQEYHPKIKSLADQLAACGSPVSEEDLILYTLDGLTDSAYRPFQTAIRTRSHSGPVSIEELQTLLVCEEISLTDEISATKSHVDSTIAMVASSNTKQPQNTCRFQPCGGQQFRGRGRGEGDQAWYTDIGATHHITVTSYLANLTLQSEYHGNDTVQVGNGQGKAIGEDSFPRAT
ncbi:uncharacterized protein LOC144544113 [Carex rostrata]